jgi:2-oxoglutarate ferredoxin oxidoreductase subunit alpha
VHDHIFIVEMNRDGQMNQLLKLEYSHCVDKFISLAFLDGLPLTARWICEQINAKEVK